MLKTVGCTILSAALAWGLGLPAPAVGAPGTDPAGGTPTGTIQVLASTLSPAAAAQLRPSLRIGARSPAVAYVQGKLGVKPASGYFGPITARAVRRVQKENGIKATGRVTARTWRVLLDSQGTVTEVPPAAPPAAAVPVPAPLPAPPAVGPVALTPEQAAATRPLLVPGMGPGDPGVLLVQQFLHVTPASGFFGKLTTKAVSDYQGGLGIPVSGTVDAATWDAILAGGTVAPAQPATSPAPDQTPPAATAPAPAAGTGATAPTPAPATIPTPEYLLPANPTAGDRALVFALAQVGKPYVLGRNGPDAFDCSSLTQQAYLAAGVRLPRLASVQRFAGTQVSIDALLPGDLLYYQDGPSPRKGHIAMFAGNGLAVEASNPRRGVRIRTLQEAWYSKRFVAAIRIG